MSAENVIPLTFQERRISAKAVCARQANPSPRRDILAGVSKLLARVSFEKEGGEFEPYFERTFCIWYNSKCVCVFVCMFEL